jgi:hypothetical protein
VRDLGKETLLDLVAFAGSGRKVPEVDFKAGRSDQFLIHFFHKRNRTPMLPPASAVINSLLACP